jgi:dicarboxylate transporter 10
MFFVGAAGSIAAITGNPAETVLVRMCVDAAKLPPSRNNYANSSTGIWRVGRDEGRRAYNHAV